MSLLVVTDDGTLRDPIRPSIQYLPYGWWMACFGEAVRCTLAANRATQTLAQLSIALGACALEQK